MLRSLLRKHLLAPLIFFGSLLLISPAQESNSRKQRVRFINGDWETVEVVSMREDQVTLRLEEIPSPLTLRWWQLDPASVAALRGTPIPTPPPPAEIPVPVSSTFQIRGARVTLKNGEILRGASIDGVGDTTLWLLSKGRSLPLQQSDIATWEPLDVDPLEVYSSEELQALLSRPLEPETAEEWDSFAARIATDGHAPRAVPSLWLADLLRHPTLPETQAHRILLDLRRHSGSEALKRSAASFQERLLIDGPLTPLDSSEPSFRTVHRILQDLRDFPIEDRLRDDHHRAMLCLLGSKALDPDVTRAETDTYINDALIADLDVLLSRRYAIDAAALQRIWLDRPTTALRKHSYAGASFLLDESSSAWADLAPNVRLLYSLGRAIERHHDVLSAAKKSCSECGGTGQKEGRERCTTCHGAGWERVVVYR